MDRRAAPDSTRRVAFRLGLLLLFLAGVSGCSSFHGRGIRYQLDHEHSAHDPQLLRSMGQLVGPGIVASNRVTAVINGARLCPATPAAIRGTPASIDRERCNSWLGGVG